MDKIKKGLGRGLSSLIGETKAEPQKNQLPISDLIPNKYQLIPTGLSYLQAVSPLLQPGFVATRRHARQVRLLLLPLPLGE